MLGRQITLNRMMYYYFYIAYNNATYTLPAHTHTHTHRATVHITIVLKNTMRVNGTKVKDVDGAGCTIATGRHMKGNGQRI